MHDLTNADRETLVKFAQTVLEGAEAFNRCMDALKEAGFETEVKEAEEYIQMEHPGETNIRKAAAMNKLLETLQ